MLHEYLLSGINNKKMDYLNNLVFHKSDGWNE